MRTPRAFLTAILLVTVSLALPAASAAAEVQPGTIRLSHSLIHHGETLFVHANVTGVNGNLTSLVYGFQNANTSDVVNVTSNLTQSNGTLYRVQHTFTLEPVGHYELQYVIACDDDGCAFDTTNLTDSSGNTPSFDLEKRPPPPPALPDLVATSVFASGNATAGSFVLLTGKYANFGNASASNFTASLYVDATLVAQQHVGFLPPGSNGTISAGWNATAGFHTLTLVVDDGNAVAETNESNNKRSTTFFVTPTLDLGIDIRGITHERLRTEAGDLPHPVPRHTIHLAITNDGDEGSFARVTLNATAQLRVVPLSTSSDIATLWVYVPARERISLDYVWEPTTTLGDVTIHAHIEPSGHVDLNRSNNHDTASDFVIVGGLGGVTL